MIGRINAGGGAGLNFKVKAYSALPEVAVDNEIAIITETPITGWAFSMTQPTDPKEGMVWTKEETISAASFNALKKNTLVVHPSKAYQYVGEEWVRKEAYSGINGEWVRWLVYLFRDGEVNRNITGGFYGEIKDGALFYEHGKWAAGNNDNFSTKEKVDLTEATKMCIRYRSVQPSSLVYLRLYVDDTSADGDKIETSGYLAWTKTEGAHDNEEHILELDVTSITDSQYVGYCWGVSVNANTSYSIEGYITEWWLE